MMEPKRWAQIALAHMRSHSKARGHPEPEFTTADLEAMLADNGEHCGCCGHELSLDGRDRYAKPSPERLDNSLHYAKGNVVLICFRCNQARADMSMWDFANWLRDGAAQMADFYGRLDAIADFNVEQ